MIVAKTDIPEGEALFSIPQKSILCVDSSELNKEIPEVLVELDDWLVNINL